MIAAAGASNEGAAMTRQRLSNRRHSKSFAFEANGLRYVATVSKFHDGRLAEIFISNSKVGSHSDAAVRDSAIVASIALQYGASLDEIRGALLRDSHSRPSSPLGHALDIVAKEEEGAA
jgi:hypothetical protein